MFSLSLETVSNIQPARLTESNTQLLNLFRFTERNMGSDPLLFPLSIKDALPASGFRSQSITGLPQNCQTNTTRLT